MNRIIKTGTAIAVVIALIATLPATAQTKASTAKTEHYDFDGEHQVVNKAYIDKILMKKMKMLQHDLSILIEKKDPNYMRAIDSAMELFNNDGTKLISVTSKNTGKMTVKPVKTYLADVAKLPYKSIDITYRNYTAIENIRKQPDGTYRGVAVFEQEFKGFDKEGKAMYSDVVRRNVEVVVKIREHRHADEHLINTDIFFGNMGVSEL